MAMLGSVVKGGAMAALVWSLVLVAQSPAAATCAGDCDADDTVTVDELVLMVNVALDSVGVERCSAGDTSGDGEISVDEIVASVDRALLGCGFISTPPCTKESCRACTAADTLCQPAQNGSYCCTLNGGFFGNPPATPPAGVNDPLDGCRFSGIYANPTPGAGNGCWSVAGEGTCHTQYVCLSGATPPPPGTATNTPAGATPTATPPGGATATSTATPNSSSPTPTATPGGGSSLYQSIGIGADWGAHWSASTTNIDPRDNQDDAAFPPEICLVANAGFQSVRLYGEPAQTWMAVVNGVQAYNQGTLSCVPGQQGPPSQPLSVVYEASICGPDPGSLPWNGAVTPATIGSVTCRPVAGQQEPVSFQASVQAEVLKLKQVLRYAGGAFADTVKLVFVGNEILFSSGSCNSGGAACSDSADCGANGPCNIAHYCSGTLSGTQAQAKTCNVQADCGAVDGPNGLCTDITNGQALAYAYDQIQSALAAVLGAGNVPPITMSIQVDVMTGTTPGLPAASAPVLWSRQQLAKSFPAKVIAVNAYPDQWGLVPAGGSVPPYPSCIEAGNAVNGSVLVGPCAGDPNAYADPVTGTLAHSIDTDVQLLTRYYPGYQVMFAETGWHTDGTCAEYNDSGASATRYSPAAAGTYLQALYQYVAGKQIPLLVFELFDQKTKTCTGNPPAEANYGVLSNYCQLKDGLQTLLPSGANLTAFKALLSPDGSGVSCKNQSLLVVQGVGNTGVCAQNTSNSCITGCGTNDNCVWGYCAETPTAGCNPDDPNNPSPCTCTRAGNCYSSASPAGFYAPSTTPIPSCSSSTACASTTCVFGSCGCYTALAPATLPAGSVAENNGIQVQYGNGSFTFTNTVGPLAMVQPQTNGTFIAQPLWDNLVVGAGWTVSLLPPSGASSGGTPSPCVNTVQSVTPGSGASITWQSPWSCSYQPGQSIGVQATQLSLPRTFLSTIPSWPPQ